MRLRTRSFRRPRLPLIAQPRKLTEAEAAALKRRPWPRLPWWLWLTVVLTIAVLAVVTTVFLRQASDGPAEVALGAVRSSPAPALTHDVGEFRVPALEPANADEAAREEVTCPRLAGAQLAGTPDDLAVLRSAAERVCALRSVGGIDTARSGLAAADAVIAFAGFELTGNDSTTLLTAPDPSVGVDLGESQVAVLVNGRYARGAPERIVPLLIHEGARLSAWAEDQPADAAAELEARRAEADACERVFAAPDAPAPNRGCTDTARLLDLPTDRALAELRAAGYD
jgi:hypothetical protein